MQAMAAMPTTEPMNERLNETARWNAVQERDRTADGLFVYAVTSTGVFCRPSCPSRRPRRDRVVFFDEVADAQAAGYRACKRCAPERSTTEDPWVEKVRRATAYLTRVEGQPSLAR